MDIGLGVGGFVDALWLSDEIKDWPPEGTVADFKIWWAGSRQQIRLIQCDSRHLRNNFTTLVEYFRPNWSSDVGRPVPDSKPVNPCE